MTSDAIEEALHTLLGGDCAASPGLVITLRRHDEYERLILRIRALEGRNEDLDRQLRSMSAYPVMYLQALDDLKLCVRMLRRAGLDTSFVQSLRH